MLRLRRTPWFITWLLAVLPLVASCQAASVEPPAVATPATTAAPTPAAPLAPVPSAATKIRLPADEAPHGGPVEWWYFNGHLQAQDGSRYAFHYVVFRLQAGELIKAEVAQLGLTDGADGRFFFEERAQPTLVGNPGQGFSFDVRGWRMQGENGKYLLEAGTGDYSFHLTTEPLMPAVLHHEDGLVDFGAAGQSYYYSWTRLKVAGTLADGLQMKEVAGLAWMDHQWGDFRPLEIGWDWFSLQLDGGAELMLFSVRDLASNSVADFGTYVAQDGKARYLSAGDFQVASQGFWRSPQTEATYPSGWQVTVPALGLALTVAPVVQEAEFLATGLLPIDYWEGEVAVTGVKGGDRIQGAGFVELVGYARRSP